MRRPAPLPATPWIDTSDVHRATYRLFCVIAGVLNPLFGLAYQVTDPGSFDPLWARLVMSVVSLLLLSLSYMAPWVERNFIVLVRTYFYLLMVNIVGLTALNSYAANYALGMLFAFMATGIVFSLGLKRQKTPLVRYLGFTVLLTTAAGLTVPAPEVSAEIVWVCVASTALIIYVAASAKMRAEDSASALEHRYETLMNAASDGILIADPDTGLVLDANEKARALLGRSLEELRRIRIAELFPEAGRARRTDAFERHVFDGHSLGNDFALLTSDGAEVPVDLSAGLVDVDGRSLVQAIFRDATDRHHYEEQLIQAKERAEELLRLKTSLLNNMSHELRTPLTAILGFAEVLEAEAQDAHREHAGVIAASARRLRETVNSVLGLAQLESGAPSLQLAPVDLASHLRETVLPLQGLAEQKGIHLEVRVWARAAYAHADATGLTRVVTNLVGNAIKFTDVGRVTVEADVEGDRAVIRVRDTGVGISAEFLPRLFDEFQQESTGLARSHEGSGLGLAITKRLVELMGGRIGVESAKGHGSTFTVSLPRAEAPDVATEPQVALSLPIDPTDRRVLVVEDNAHTRELLRMSLAPLCHVVTVGDPDEAVAHARRTTFDGFILDINLTSTRDGVALLEELRAVPGHAHAAAAALTAYAMPEDRARFLRAGFDHYLAKPFDKRQLFELFLQLFPAETEDARDAGAPAHDLDTIVEAGHLIGGQA